MNADKSTVFQSAFIRVHLRLDMSLQLMREQALLPFLFQLVKTNPIRGINRREYCTTGTRKKAI
jgi:hypothetical protein